MAKKPIRTKLNLSERIRIAHLLLKKKNFKEIAIELGRAEETISSEIERGGGVGSYDAEKGQIFFSQYRLPKIKNTPITEEEKEEIRSLRRSGITIRKIREMTRRGNVLVNQLVKDIPVSAGCIDRRTKLHRQLDSMQEQIDILFEMLKEGQK